MDISQQDWDTWIEHATTRPSYSPQQRAAMRKAMSILGQPSIILLMRKAGAISYADASAILAIPISAIQDAEKVAIRRLKVLTEILIVDWSTVPELYSSPQGFPQLTYMHVLDCWAKSLNVCSLASDIGVGRTTATLILSRLREILQPYGLDHHITPDRRIAIHRGKP